MPSTSRHRKQSGSTRGHAQLGKGQGNQWQRQRPLRGRLVPPGWRRGVVAPGRPDRKQGLIDIGFFISHLASRHLPGSHLLSRGPLRGRPLRRGLRDRGLVGRRLVGRRLVPPVWKREGERTLSALCNAKALGGHRGRPLRPVGRNQWQPAALDRNQWAFRLHIMRTEDRRCPPLLLRRSWHAGPKARAPRLSLPPCVPSKKQSRKSGIRSARERYQSPNHLPPRCCCEGARRGERSRPPA